MKLIKNLSEHKKIFKWLAIFWTAIVAFFCLANFNELPKVSVSNYDKLGHITFHFGIVFLWFLYYRLNENKKALLKAFSFSFFYGIAIEICQALFTKTRSGDIFDVFANITGALLAVVFIFLIKKYISKKN